MAKIKFYGKLRVSSIIPGDDHVRKVMIKCMGGESELLRPVTRLLPLEFA